MIVERFIVSQDYLSSKSPITRAVVVGCRPKFTQDSRVSKLFGGSSRRSVKVF